MPTLDFKGKQFVYAHHLTVPFRQMNVDAKKSMPKDGKPSLDDNLIIHGDNLHALKALLPKYAGKVKCIYIDPPYNTGNEGWCYNDNVNAPLIREWLKDSANPVDYEDLERHDKWLSMMWPRLQLLKELLSEDGVLFISIDDNESAHLIRICDDIFGEENFFCQVIVRANSRGQTYKQIAKTHEYLLVYTRNPEVELNELEKVGERDDLDLEDEIGRFNVRELRNRNPKFGKHNRPNLFYPVYVNPDTEDSDSFCSVSLASDKKHSERVEPFNSEGKASCWRWGQEKAKENISVNTRKSNLVARKRQDGSFAIYEKYRKSTYKPKSIWDDNKYLTETGTVEVNALGIKDFPFPKPKGLIEDCIRLACGPEDIVLDSFAGSGTTAHAVLALNKEDEGNRKFILVECENYADKTTAERVRRVIKGVKVAKDDDLKKGLGGSFTFCELGDEINIENLLKGDKLPSYDELARYAFYTATGQTLDKVKHGADFFVGETENYRVHVIYEPDTHFLRSQESALNLPLAERISKGLEESKKTALVFATHKFMGQKELSEMGITYCQLPYAIHRVMGG